MAAYNVWPNCIHRFEIYILRFFEFGMHNGHKTIGLFTFLKCSNGISILPNYLQKLIFT
ncbi:MAG: hypothetical protein RL037_461 [Bacteroidota bacterium]